MIEKDETTGSHPATDAGETPAAPSAAVEAPQARKQDSFPVFLLKLALIVAVFRSFVFSPFSIPSESMLPGLMNGDYLLAAKWPYGFSRYSLPFDLQLFPGRIFAGQPERGDVVIFKHPLDNTDYIKRVIGLPGDTVAMREGQVILNGEAVPKVPVADFLIPLSPNTRCHPLAEEGTVDGRAVCRYHRFRESLPSGRSYDVLDLGNIDHDNTQPVIVPEGQLFVMGDNRDNSQDSRFPAMIGGGVGLLPQERLVGRATILMWSTDGSSSWLLPRTWFTAARWGRLGTML